MAETVEMAQARAAIESEIEAQVDRVARPPVRRFRPFRGGLTLISLAVAGLVVLSPRSAGPPDRVR